MSESVLRVAGLSVARRRGGRVLDDVALEVGRGECLAVVGESGAGKSVLARTLLGLTQADPAWNVAADRFEVAGEDVARASGNRWRRLRGSRVALVMQDALQSLDPLRTIEAEVGEALAVRGVPRGERKRAAIAALEAAGLTDAGSRLRQRATEFSGGMRQRALIASALIGEPALLIADEPTTALDPTTATRVLDLFGEIRDAGTGILLISHDLHAVARVADRIAVIDHGRIVEVGTADDVLRRPRHEATRGLVAAIPSGAKPTPAPPEDAPVLMTATGVARRFAVPALRNAGAAGRVGDSADTGTGTGTGTEPRTVGVHGVDLSVRRGEAIGVVGESGAGKSTLARMLVGAEWLDAGRIETDARVRLIPQDPYATFDPRWKVERIVSASIRPLADGSTPTAAALLASVGLPAEILGRRPATLSGGQRQRVAIARALAADPDVLVCDEPVSALDVSTQAGILELLRGLQRDRGLALVFVSHDLAAVRTVCDRLLVMRGGRVVEEGPTERLFASAAHPYARELIDNAA